MQKKSAPVNGVKTPLYRRAPQEGLNFIQAASLRQQATPTCHIDPQLRSHMARRSNC
jgi:hypothetical protein